MPSTEFNTPRNHYVGRRGQVLDNTMADHAQINSVATKVKLFRTKESKEPKVLNKTH